MKILFFYKLSRTFRSNITRECEEFSFARQLIPNNVNLFRSNENIFSMFLNCMGLNIKNPKRLANMSNECWMFLKNLIELVCCFGMCFFLLRKLFDCEDFCCCWILGFLRCILLLSDYEISRNFRRWCFRFQYCWVNFFLLCRCKCFEKHKKLMLMFVGIIIGTIIVISVIVMFLLVESLRSKGD